MSVTMADVAKEAGVDKATVSRVLKGDPRISPKTREKVWEVIKRLGYKPNALARGLSARKSGLVYIVFEEQDLPQMNRFLRGVGRILAAMDKEPIVYVADYFDADFIRSRSMAHKVEGIIWVGSPPSDMDVPMVAVGDVTNRYVYVSPFWSDIAKEIKKIANGRKIVFVGDTKANSMLKRELAECGTDGENTLWICDGSLPGGIKRLIHPVDQKFLDIVNSDGEFTMGDLLLLFNDINYAKALGGGCIYLPSLEMGVLAARLLVNMLKNREVPQKNLVRLTIEF